MERTPPISGRIFRPTISLGLLGVLGVALYTCHPPAPERDPIQEIKDAGQLIILTRNAPTTYYQGRDELEGVEYELAVSFANHLGVEPVFKIMDNTGEILEAIARNEGHIAAAGLTRTREREKRFSFGPDYQWVQQQVICRRWGPRPKSIEDLYGLSITVIANSSYDEQLDKLCLEYPDLSWTTTDEMETEQLLEEVWNQAIDCTVADTNIVDINRRYLPELVVSFALTEKQPLAWVLAPDFVALKPVLDHWYLEMEEAWEIDHLMDRYYGYAQIYDYVDIKRFHKRIEERLPEFLPVFKKAAERYGLSWTLLAAQAYQESHWDIHARSPTGVRGIMMLTQRTAKQLGVYDRLNPNESIMGGAKYLARIYRRLPEKILEPDRTWIALACYNVGYGHVMDARGLAIEEKLDPNLWRNVRRMLPRLSQKKYYRKLRYGYARGREPVRYVQRIRNFNDILDQRLNSGETAAGD